MIDHGLGELTQRHPHEHLYRRPGAIDDLDVLHIHVNQYGAVSISEEMLDTLLTTAGCTRIDTLEVVAP